MKIYLNGPGQAKYSSSRKGVKNCCKDRLHAILRPRLEIGRFESASSRAEGGHKDVIGCIRQFKSPNVYRWSVVHDLNIPVG